MASSSLRPVNMRPKTEIPPPSSPPSHSANTKSEDRPDSAAAALSTQRQGMRSKYFSGYSYAKTLVCLWAIVLVVLCVKQLFFVVAVVTALLTLSILPSADGDAKMLFPLFILSERLLVESTSLRHSPVMLFGCMLFAYVSNVSSSPLSAALPPNTVVSAPSAPSLSRRGVQAAEPHRKQPLLKVGSFRSSRLAFVYAGVGVAAIFFLTSQIALAVAIAAYTLTALFSYGYLLEAVTMREAVVVAHLAGFFACDALVNVNLNPAAFKELTITSFSHIGGRSAVLMSMGVVATMTLLGCGRIVSRHVWWSNSSKAGKERALAFTVSFACCITAAYIYCGRVFEEDPSLWLFQYVLSSPVRALGLLSWVIGIPIAVRFISSLNTQKVVPKIIYRKFYHFLALVAFLPVGVLDPEFLALSVMIATALGILAECARVCKLPLPLMESVNQFMLTSIDGREGGGGDDGDNSNGGMAATGRIHNTSQVLTRKQAALAASARRRFAENKAAEGSSDGSVGGSDSEPFSPSSVVEGVKTFAPEEATRHGPKSLIRTHLFLLFGLAMPIILHSRQQQMPARPLSPIVLCSLFLVPGLVGLGVMDSAAAACGTSYWRLIPLPGRKRCAVESTDRKGVRIIKQRAKATANSCDNTSEITRNNSAPENSSPLRLHRVLCGTSYGFTADANSALTHKTVEGTIGGLTAAFVVWGCVLAFLVFGAGIPFHVRAAIPSVAAIVLGALFEAFADGIDNLELPLFMGGIIQTAVLVLGKFF